MEYERLVPDVDDYDDDNSLASLFCLCCAALGRAHPCRGKQAALAESCEKHRKNFEKLRNLSCVLERTSSALLAFKNKDCLCCAGLAGRRPRRGQQAALADSSVFHKNYTRSLERESISAQFFLYNSFRIVFRIRLMLKMNDDG